MNRIQLNIILFACVIFINACGQSGDLYLPEEEQGEVVTQEASSEDLQEEEPDKE